MLAADEQGRKKRDVDDAQRLLFRSTHIYLLLTSLLKLYLTESLEGRLRVSWELYTGDGRRHRVVRKGLYEFEDGGGRLTSTDPAAFDPWAR